MADQLKAKGNAAFSAGNYPEAIELFSQAVQLDPSNHVLYSNRSAAKASLEEYDEALEDAKKCVELKPDWPKGYSRLGAAYYGMEQWTDAIEAYETGLKYDPNNAQMQTALKDAQAASRSKAKSPFGGPEIMGKLVSDPRTRQFLAQPDFMAMIRDVSANPANMSKYLQDPRFQVAMEVMFGISMSMPTGSESNGPSTAGRAAEADAAQQDAATSSGQRPSSSRAQPAEDTKMAEATPEELSEKQQALAEKERGNEAYKKKDFATAIEHYNRALELYDQDVSFLTNRAAVYFEMKDYESCIADCDKAIERGRELRADYKLVARAMTRKGNALRAQDKLEEAVAVFNKSLMEHRNADTLKRLQETEKLLKERREAAYVDMALCEQEREQGNTAFKEMKYPEAVQHYTEALKRGPPSVNPEAHKLYSNLAACYTKLGAYPEGLKAAERCIELEPSFVKGYSRKGAIQFFMKEYDKALRTYEDGLSHDPGNEELKEGKWRCIEAIQRISHGEGSEDELKERQAKAMQDPDVQNILMDPIMRQVLNDMQTDPKAAQKHLKHPDIMAKVSKLVSAGVVQMR